MAASYIPVSLDDFRQVFDNLPDKRAEREKPAFTLVTPDREEAHYTCTLGEYSGGKLCLKVYTSVAAFKGESVARSVGKDAIRIALVWDDNEGWSAGIGKNKRVNRSGSGTAADVVNRAVVRARELATEWARGNLKMPRCPKCGRPMSLRSRRDGSGEFWGCIGYGSHRACCNGTRQV